MTSNLKNVALLAIGVFIIWKIMRPKEARAEAISQEIADKTHPSYKPDFAKTIIYAAQDIGPGLYFANLIKAKTTETAFISEAVNSGVISLGELAESIVTNAEKAKI